MSSKIPPDSLPNNCRDARETGSKYYFTGKPCKRGHVDIRLTSTRSCMECNREDAREYREDNLEIVTERQRIWREGNREKSRECSKKWAKENPKRVKDNQRRYNKENRESLREKEREYKSKNRGKYRLYQLNRKINEDRATPKWVDQSEIEYIYKLASEKGLEVDHIVPLNSDYVCGLHTGDNLRCISKELNSYKGNRYWPDMPEELIKEVFE